MNVESVGDATPGSGITKDEIVQRLREDATRSVHRQIADYPPEGQLRIPRPGFSGLNAEVVLQRPVVRWASLITDGRWLSRNLLARASRPSFG
jgi:hypothetical protein